MNWMSAKEKKMIMQKDDYAEGHIKMIQDAYKQKDIIMKE